MTAPRIELWRVVDPKPVDRTNLLLVAAGLWLLLLLVGLGLTFS